MHREARKQLGLQTAQILGVIFLGEQGKSQAKEFKSRPFLRIFSNIAYVRIIFKNTAVCWLPKPGGFTLH